MSLSKALKKLIENMSEEQVRELLNFGEYLMWQEERAFRRAFGQAQLAHVYGPEEPEYTLADVKQEFNS